MVQQENLDLDEEKERDKTIIECTYTDNQQEPEKVNKDLCVKVKQLKEICDKYLDVEPSSSSKMRILFMKTLADIIESLSALAFCSKYSEKENDKENKVKEAMNFASVFLKENSVLESTYSDSVKKIQETGVTDLLNKNCVFKEELRNKQLQMVLKNDYYKFKHPEFAYQAMTHPTALTIENQNRNHNYVTKSYQRLAFLGEAILELYVSLFVFQTNEYENECTLHKMRICGINHHIISYLSLLLKLDDCLQRGQGGGIKSDVEAYKKQLLSAINKQDKKMSIRSQVRS